MMIRLLRYLFQKLIHHLYSRCGPRKWSPPVRSLQVCISYLQSWTRVGRSWVSFPLKRQQVVLVFFNKFQGNIETDCVRFFFLCHIFFYLAHNSFYRVIPIVGLYRLWVKQVFMSYPYLKFSTSIILSIIMVSSYSICGINWKGQPQEDQKCSSTNSKIVRLGY